MSAFRVQISPQSFGLDHLDLLSAPHIGELVNVVDFPDSVSGKSTDLRSRWFTVAGVTHYVQNGFAPKITVFLAEKVSS